MTFLFVVYVDIYCHFVASGLFYSITMVLDRPFPIQHATQVQIYKKYGRKSDQFPKSPSGLKHLELKLESPNIPRLAAALTDASSVLPGNLQFTSVPQHLCS